MKVRSDFVTNSSSSSFILAFNKTEDTKGDISSIVTKAVNDNIYYDNPKDYYSHVPQIISMILDSLVEPIDVEKLPEIVEKEFYWIATYIVEQNFEREHRRDHIDHLYAAACEFRRSEEGKKEVDRLVKDKIAYVQKKVASKDLIYLVSFSDDDSCGSDIEHYILPNSTFTVAMFNHH